MQKFLAIYLGTTDDAAMAAWNAMGDEEKKAKEQAGMEAWGKWMADHKESVEDVGAPLGKTKRIDKSGVADTKNAMSGYVVVQAESHDAAAALFEGHPHFTIFPGESVEVMACLPMPQM